MKKWAIGIFTTVIVMFILAGFRDRLIEVWATPDKVKDVSQKVESQAEVQNQLSKLVVEQQARLEKQETVTELQVQSLKEQIQASKEQVALIAELKKKR